MDDFIKNKARTQIFNLQPYVPGKPIDEAKRELGIDDVIKLASNENSLGPSPLAMKAVQEFLPYLHQYPDSNCYYLRKKLAERFDVDEKCILLGNGSDEILKLLAETFTNPGDRVIYARPTFSEYDFAAAIMGAECTTIPLLDYKHDLAAMADAINERTKMVIICNPNNPTGTIVSGFELDNFMARVPDDVLVIFDEAYCEYADPGEFVSGFQYLRDGRKVIVMRTFSKLYGLAGLRVGYAFAPAAIASAAERVREPFNVNMPAQVAALAALDDNGHVSRTLTMNAEGKSYLYQELDRMGLKYVPTQANFILVDTGRPCQEVFRDMLALGVIIRNCDVYTYDSCIRVTIGNYQENSRFINSLKKVLSYYQKK
jgi:histidinol-phosphate aminotransferase